MRAYLQTKPAVDERVDLVLHCQGCGDTTPLSKMYPAGTAPTITSQINVLRLTEFIGRFTMIHCGCPDEPKS